MRTWVSVRETLDEGSVVARPLMLRSARCTSHGCGCFESLLTIPVAGPRGTRTSKMTEAPGRRRF